MQMPRSQVNIILHHTSQFGRSRGSVGRLAGQIVRRALARFATVFDHRAHAEAAIASRHLGQRWTDLTERLRINDIEKLDF